MKLSYNPSASPLSSDSRRRQALCERLRPRARVRHAFVLHNASASGTIQTGQEDHDHSGEQSAPSTSNSDTSSEASSKSGTLQRFWAKYNEALEKKPIFVKSMTSLVGFALGDCLAQVISGGQYNVLRTLRLTLFGIFMDGPVGHLWYTTLDKYVRPHAPKSNKTVLLKTFLDQFVWAPIFTCVFFTFMCCLEGRPSYVLPSIQKKLVSVLLANYLIWPLAHIINFKFIPSSQRILYINVCQVLWSSYLSACQANAN